MLCSRTQKGPPSIQREKGTHPLLARFRIKMLVSLSLPWRYSNQSSFFWRRGIYIWHKKSIVAKGAISIQVYFAFFLMGKNSSYPTSISLFHVGGILSPPRRSHTQPVKFSEVWANKKASAPSCIFPSSFSWGHTLLQSKVGAYVNQYRFTIPSRAPRVLDGLMQYNFHLLYSSRQIKKRLFSGGFNDGFCPV